MTRPRPPMARAAPLPPRRHPPRRSTTRPRCSPGSRPSAARTPRAAAADPPAQGGCRRAAGRSTRRDERPGRSNVTPRSRSETHASWPMTTWSSTSTSSRRPAAIASAVRWRSSGDGVGSPRRVVVARARRPRRPAGRRPGTARRPAPATRTRCPRRRGHPLDHVLRVEAEHAELLALEAAHLHEQPVRDVPRRPDGPASRPASPPRSAAPARTPPRAAPPWRRRHPGSPPAPRPWPARAPPRSRAGPAPPRPGPSRSARRSRCPRRRRSAPPPRARRARAGRAARGAARRREVAHGA